MVVIALMAAFETNELDRPKQQGCPSVGSHGGCGHCSEAMDQENQDQPLKLGQVILVFFLPLACAVALVITAVNYLPTLAEHPGYLALSALGIACLALVLVKIFTHRAKATKQRG